MGLILLKLQIISIAISLRSEGGSVGKLFV